jgi:hypothetical protein
MWCMFICSSCIRLLEIRQNWFRTESRWASPNWPCHSPHLGFIRNQSLIFLNNIIRVKFDNTILQLMQFHLPPLLNPLRSRKHWSNYAFCVSVAFPNSISFNSTKSHVGHHIIFQTQNRIPQIRCSPEEYKGSLVQLSKIIFSIFELKCNFVWLQYWWFLNVRLMEVIPKC